MLLFSFVAFFSEGDPGLRVEKNLGNQNQKKNKNQNKKEKKKKRKKKKEKKKK